MNNINTPGDKWYDGVKEHEDYPEYSLYSLLEESAKKHSNFIAYNYFGKKAIYSSGRLKKSQRHFFLLG